MRTTFGSWRGRLALAVAALFAIAGGIAYASIPGAGGVINGCYRTSLDDQKGQLRVVSEAGNCRNNELPIQWSVTGPPGPPGVDGEDGEDGEPFAGTFTSPNGQYSLAVTDAGIRLAGLGSTIVLDATGIQIESSSALKLESDQGMSLRAGTNLDAEAGSFATVTGAGVTVDSGTLLRLEGQVVRIGPGPGCSPVARLGDAISGTAAGSSVSGVITTGSPLACIG